MIPLGVKIGPTSRVTSWNKRNKECRIHLWGKWLRAIMALLFKLLMENSINLVLVKSLIFHGCESQVCVVLYIPHWKSEGDWKMELRFLMSPQVGKPDTVQSASACRVGNKKLNKNYWEERKKINGFFMSQSAILFVKCLLSLWKPSCAVNYAPVLTVPSHSHNLQMRWTDEMDVSVCSSLVCITCDSIIPIQPNLCLALQYCVILKPFGSAYQCLCLTLAQTSPWYNVSAVQVLWKHCGKRRNCS